MALEHWTFRKNVHGNKDLLKDLRRVLTNEIQRRKPREPEHLDFRFLLPLAQWLCEQGGYTMKPKGNNPGNVMGKGDLGDFNRPDNIEIVGGKEKNVPAKFAQFSTMEAGTKATLDHLQERWFGTYTQILDGGSAEAYVRGLYPGRGKDYATQFQSVYLAGVRHRLANIIQDFISVIEDDLKEADRDLESIKRNYNAAMQDNSEMMFGTPRLHPGVISHNMNQRRMLDSAEKVATGLQNQQTVMEQENAKRKALLEEQLKELKEVQKRFKEGQNIQPAGAVTAAAGSK
ncbi:MAG: hypothetical protein JSS81_15025 [Acidobacteria bacterium]|nr:hypothetical protein [Acidobacteriota bacterium]